MDNSMSAALAALQGQKNILVATHVNPDGDALGSAVALCHLGLSLGAQCRLLLVTGIPDNLSWFPLPCPWVRKPEDLSGWRPDLIATVDCGDAQRTGLLEKFFTSGIPPLEAWQGVDSLNIDHHLGNPLFANHNWVEPQRSATAEMIGDLAEHHGLPLRGDLGAAVFMGITTDTGDFTFSNTTASCLAMAARIVDHGFSVAEFTAKYENNWSLEQMRLWGRLMGEITLHADGAISLCLVPRRYLSDNGLNASALEGFASWLRKLRGVRVGIFLREESHKLCKLSLRSADRNLDMRAIAAHFNGGGHVAAAGAELTMKLHEAAHEVLIKVKEAVEKAGPSA